MGEILIDKDEVSLRRKGSGWRSKGRTAVQTISEPISDSLFLHFSEGASILRGARELDAIGPAGRRPIWDAVFPGIAREVEIAWSNLPASTIARRDGGLDGEGTLFAWKLSENESYYHRITWLRKLLIAVGPFPELDFSSVIRNIHVITSGRIDEAGYDQESYTQGTGHSYDSDAPAYAACALLDAEPESALALEVEKIFRDQLVCGENCGIRPIFTAFLCADRPDLWKWVDEHLAHAGIEAGFRDALVGFRRGTHPGAWVHLLKTISDQHLLRFSFLEQKIKAWFGIDWQWKSSERAVLQSWLERWIELHESRRARSEAWQKSDPGDFLLALWAEAVWDGEAALAEVEQLSELDLDRRLAAAHFLSVCPSKQRAVTAVQLATDADLRVAAAAQTLLTGYGGGLPSNSEMPDLFTRVVSFVTHLPENRTLPPAPAPFPSREFHPQIYWQIIAERFPDGAEKIVERFLPEMSEETRDGVVHRLNRYQLSTSDREMAKVIHGRDPDEWAAWEADHRGDVSFLQRRLLLGMMDDRSVSVAEHAYKAVRSFTLTADEFELIRPTLNSSSTKKRLGATKLLTTQPVEYACAKVAVLLKSKRKYERLSGLEILRALAEDSSKTEAAKAVWTALDFEARSAEEIRAAEVLRKAFQKETAVAKPSVENAFGLVNPAELLPPTPPREHPVLLHSPVTQKLIDLLDNWYSDHSNDVVPSARPWMGEEKKRLAEAVPYVHTYEPREANLSRFPSVISLVEAWVNRSADPRDVDRQEYYRLRLAFHSAEHRSIPPMVLNAFFGSDTGFSCRTNSSRLGTLLEWIKFLVPDEGEHGDVDNFLIDAAETVYVRLPEKQKNWPWWSSYAHQRLSRPGVSTQVMARLWALGRNPPLAERNPFSFSLSGVAQFFNAGIASESELIWHLVGDRKLQDRYARECAFASLREATGKVAPGHKDLYGTTKFQAVVQRVVDRLLDLALSRGEEPEQWSYAVKSISQIYGAKNLRRLLQALGSSAIKQKRRDRYGEEDFTRPAVLQHLASVSLPSEDESTTEFSRLMREASIPDDQLFEIAMLQPAWVRYVEEAVDIPGIRDAIGWVFAHTRSRDYVWNERARLLWAGELGFQSPIPADEFIAGVVDPDWFLRIYKKVGEDVWSKLYQAARLASTGSGHTRARLYADALLDRVTVDELEKLLREKENLDAAMAIGLPSLPSSKRQLDTELLRRYTILQRFRKLANKSKPQRRASEEAAFQIAVWNLARRAGFDDTLRFEWSMETQACADLAAGALHAKVDETEFAVIITPGGTLELQVIREGKILKDVPSKLKKHPQVAALRQRMAELREQAQRIRPGLESLMERGLYLPVAEWRRMLNHPLAGPLLARLVFAGKEEGILGMALSDSDGLVQADETVKPWPDSASEICLAHPVDFLPAARWHAWQRFAFARKIVQPFKQIFRELYLITKLEAAENNCTIRRYSQQQVVTRQAFSILSNRGWVFHPERGLHRIFRENELTAWIVFTEFFHHPRECENATIREVSFTRNKRSEIAAQEIPPRIFSEVMRDVDLIVSVAHATGTSPETSLSTLETRAALIRETCAMLGLTNVLVGERHAEIAGSLANYRIHLASGTVHRVPGAMIPVQTDPEPERGRIFLPFADNDPVSCSLLTKVILFAHDETIKDPSIVGALRPV